MPRVERNGKRKTRDQLSKQRIPELGYYFIVTDTKETEQNYMLGLRDSIPEHLQGKLVIKVIKKKTKDLVEEARDLASLHPQYGEPWIVFDRDQVKDFDEIIAHADACGINAGWTNPCIEEWFSAYFGTMPTYAGSVTCCDGFATTFERASGQKYDKADPEIYRKLNRLGNEQRAIEIAAQKFEEHKRNGKDKPSDMSPCTTVHLLVSEIKGEVGDEN